MPRYNLQKTHFGISIMDNGIIVASESQLQELIDLANLGHGHFFGGEIPDKFLSSAAVTVSSVGVNNWQGGPEIAPALAEPDCDKPIEVKSKCTCADGDAMCDYCNQYR